ncbi:hypothetical protein LTR95_014195 [Oleoguttula sp. CCFEE 5521]
MYPKHRRRYFWNLEDEYLLYGPVEVHHVTGPASAFADAGVEMALTIAEIVKHRDCLAEIYGENLAVAVVASSLCVAKRNFQDWLVRGHEAKIFTEIMKDFDVPNVEGRYAHVMRWGVGALDERQSEILMRAYNEMHRQYVSQSQHEAALTASESEAAHNNGAQPVASLSNAMESFLRPKIEDED